MRSDLIGYYLLNLNGIESVAGQKQQFQTVETTNGFDWNQGLVMQGVFIKRFEMRLFDQYHI